MNDNVNQIYVGYFDLYGVFIHLEKRPLFLHRVMMRALLGARWVDFK